MNTIMVKIAMLTTGQLKDDEGVGTIEYLLLAALVVALVAAIKDPLTTWAEGEVAKL